MNREEIIRMAIETGLVYKSNNRLWMDAGEPEHDLEEFVALVIEAERNRLARECAMLPFGDTAASFAVWIKNGGKA